MAHLPDPCHRARSLASSALDDELSELEARLLETHLWHCADCAAFASEIAAVTAMLRAEPQVRHSVEIMPRIRRARRTVRGRAAVVSAGMLVAASVLGVLASVTPSGSVPPPAPSSQTDVSTPAVSGPLGEGRGVPIVVRTQLPLGQLKAGDDF
jgi:predicted anti-sigma-YlaC factor YlaD